MTRREEPTVRDGCSYAYKYRDPKSGLFCLTEDRREAARAGDDYELVPVRLEGGRITGLLRVREGGKAQRVVRPDPVPGEPLASPPEKDEQLDYLDDLPVLEDLTDEGWAIDTEEDEYPKQPRNGLGHAYRFRDSETGEYVLSDRRELALLAAVFGEEAAEAVWVCYKDGKIDHVATIDEWQTELEIRIGARVSANMTREEQLELDRLIDHGTRGEAEAYLERFCPNKEEIIELTKREMFEARVLDPGA